MNNIEEITAELAHDQWSGWMEYLFSKGKFNGDGTWTMTGWAVDRWRRQVKTGYKDLSEDEKESDRVEARKFISQLNKDDETWISVDDRLPDIKTDIIGYTLYDGIIYDLYLQDNKEWCTHYTRWMGGKVTHWMPLLSPPKTKEGS